MFLLLVCLVTLAELSLAASANATNFGIGDTVEVYGTGASGLVVRGPNACDSQVGGKFDGDWGVVLAGPTYCNSYNRWKIRWSDGLEGWSAENWLRKVTVTLSLYMHDGSISGPLLPGVRVTGSDGAGKGFDMTTDSNGLAAITGSPGTWSFTASKAGYETVSWTKSVTASVRNDGWLVPSNKPPSCSLSSSPRSGKAPLAVTFTLAANDPDGSIASWVLDVNGDGNADYSGTGNPPSTRTYNYTNPGMYRVAFMVMDNKGAYSDACLDTINVGSNQPPTASLSANPTSGAAPLTVTFSISASDPDGTITTWVLDYGDGTSDSGSGAPPSTKAHTYSSQGTYTAALAVSDNNDATAFSTKTITVNPSAQLPSVSTYDASDAGIMSAKLNGNLDSTGGESCQVWFEYGLTISYGNSTPKELKPSAGSFSYSVSGLQSDKTYHFRACASNSKGSACGSDRTFTTLEPINQPPNPPTNLAQLKYDFVTEMPVGYVTDEKTVFLRADAADPDGDKVGLQIELRQVGNNFLQRYTQQSSLVNTSQVSVAAYGLVNGDYHWQARVMDEHGLASAWVEFGDNPTAAVDFSVRVNYPPFAAFTYSPATPEIGQAVSFDASSSYDPDGGALSYQWDFGDGAGGSGSKVTHTYSKTGSYAVALTVTDDEGSTGKKTVTINIASKELQQAIEHFFALANSSLNSITADAKNTADAADFFGLATTDDQNRALLGLFFTIAKKLLSLGGILELKRLPVLSISQYLNLMDKYPSWVVDALDDYGWVAVEFTKEALIDGFKAVATDILNGFAQNNYKYYDTLYVPLENGNAYRMDKIEGIKSEALSAFGSLSQDEVEIYKKDIRGRNLANMYISNFYSIESLLPTTFRDIKIDESADWRMKLGKGLLWVGMTSGEIAMCLGTGGLGCTMVWGISAISGTLEDMERLDLDLQMLEGSVNALSLGFTYSEDINRNSYQALKNIKERAVPHTAEGKIVSVENFGMGFIGEPSHYNKWYSFWYTDIYSDVRINNTGKYATIYELFAPYVMDLSTVSIFTFPINKYRIPVVISGQKRIEPGQTDTVRLWFKENDHGVDPKNMDIDIYLLGRTDNGMYGLESVHTRFGTTKIVLSNVSISDEDLNNATMYPYPIRLDIVNMSNGSQTNYSLDIYVENPFGFPVQANLTQEMPTGVAFSTDDGTVNGSNVSWQLELAANERDKLNITLNFGDQSSVEIRGALLEIYDRVQDNWIAFASNNLTVCLMVLLGDATKDFKVDIFDLAAVGLAFSSRPGDNNWSPEADLTGDGMVNIFDLATVGLNYGKVC